mgnify:FL=1
MPIKRQQLVNDEIYHIVTRAAGDSLLFKNIDDYYRGIFSIYEFNNQNPIEIRVRREQRKKEKANGERFSVDLRECLVEILAFCFMPNHVHLILKQIKECGISNFMRKFGAGYAGYFNKKHNRKGPLLSKFRAVHIKTNEQLKNCFVYVHANPLSLIEPGWKENGIKLSQKAIGFLEEEYKWSSYWDYIGKKNFPSITERKFILEIMEREEGCCKAIRNWIEYKKGIITSLGNIIIE